MASFSLKLGCRINCSNYTKCSIAGSRICHRSHQGVYSKSKNTLRRFKVSVIKSKSPMVFFPLKELNEFRNHRLNSLATLIQKTFRCYSQRLFFHKMRKSQIVISSAWRTWRVCEFLWIHVFYFSLHDFCMIFILNSSYIKNIIKECCRIPISERRHLWGLYRVVIIFFSIWFLINF